MDNIIDINPNITLCEIQHKIQMWQFTTFENDNVLYLQMSLPLYKSKIPFSDVVYETTTKKLTQRPTESTTFENTGYKNSDTDEEGKFYQHYSNPGNKKNTYSWSSKSSIKIPLLYLVILLEVVMFFI